MMSDSAGNSRALVAVIPQTLHERLIALAPEGEVIAALVTDAIARLDAVLAVGGEVDTAGTADDPVLLEVAVPWWAAEQLDRAIGVRPGLGDRSSTLSAALKAHLSALEPEAPAAQRSAPRDLGREMPAARRDLALRSSVADDTLIQRALSTSAIGPSSRSGWAGRAERSLRRLQALVGGDADDRLDIKVLFPPDPIEVVGIEPGEVAVGLAPSSVVHPLDALPAPAGRVPGVRLSGLTNRIAPTLWATSRLVRMQATNAGRPVRYHDFLLAVMPEAWSIGAGLSRAERNSARSPFSASARWPKVSRRLSTRASDEPFDDERVQKLAQAATSFIEYSLIAFPGASKGRGRLTGPMAALGLAQIWSEGEDLWVAADPAAVSLLEQLHELGISCAYPHSYEAWQAYEAYLIAHARCDEAMDQLHLLDILETSTSRADFYEKASSFKLTPKQLERLSERAREGKSTKGYSTEANGFIGRLREWGLVVMDQGAFGPGALTPGGRDALDRFRRGGIDGRT